jgi:hypothetical protein
MAITPKTKKTLIIVGVVAVLAVVAYFVWQWYEGNQASNSNSTGTDVGTNLNSPAPVLEGGSSSGDNSAPAYSTGQETVNVTLPNGDESVTGSSSTGTTSTTGTTGLTTSTNPSNPGSVMQVAVPNVVGRKDLDTAKGMITAKGLKAASTGNGAGNKGSVTAESPKAGTSVPLGSTVTLTYTVPK